VAPLRLGGLRGKKSTPSAWLGGTGELIDVGKQEQEQLGKGAAGSTQHRSDYKAKVWLLYLGRIECLWLMLVSKSWLYLDVLVVICSSAIKTCYGYRLTLSRL
jgi:hypothetical protein